MTKSILTCIYKKNLIWFQRWNSDILYSGVPSKARRKFKTFDINWFISQIHDQQKVKEVQGFHKEIIENMSV